MQHEHPHLHPSLTVAELTARLKRIERLYAITLLGGLAALVATFAVFQAQAPIEPHRIEGPLQPADGTFDRLKCRNFAVVDENDMPRVEIDAHAHGSCRIRLLDGEHYERYRMVADEADQTYMEILDAKGTKRLIAGSLPGDVCGLDLLDAHGTTRVVMLVDEDNDCSVKQFDGSGNERLSHMVLDKGSPLSAWHDADGAMRVVATVSEKYGGIIDMNDAEMKTRVRTFCRNDGGAGTVVFDPEERHRIVMECDAEGMSAIRWWDELKRLRLVGGTIRDDLAMPIFDVLDMEDEKPSWSTQAGKR